MTSSSSDEEDGPLPLDAGVKRLKLDVKTLTLLDALPNATRYEKSWLHLAPLTHVCSLSRTHFVATGSEDGVIKFWKHVGGSQVLEFVKQYQAHHFPLSSLSGSADGENLCSTSAEEHTIRFFLVRTFDMSAFVVVEESFFPHQTEWIGHTQVCIACNKSAQVRVYNCTTCDMVLQIPSLGMTHLACMAFLPAFKTLVAGDANGMINYWTESGDPPPVRFTFKSDTDLFDLCKRKVIPTCIRASPLSHEFAVCGHDGSIRVFDFLSGKILWSVNTDSMKIRFVCFDQTGRLLLVPSPIRGGQVDVFQNGVVVSSILGSMEEEEDFEFGLHPLALSQEILTVDSQLERNTNLVQLSKEHSILTSSPMLICLHQDRFMVFTKHEPSDVLARNVQNERPSAQQILKAQLEEKQRKARGLASHCVLHTTLGDIKLELFPLECPRTVENFLTHSRSTYKDVSFHRVIRGFMVQSGCPLGDGTGGESMWGGTFEDEISPVLHFNQPFLLCMANRGKNTNGSQFFITTSAECAHLEGKHTIFGKVVGESSQEVVKKIEAVKVDNKDRPIKDVRIVNVSVG